ncbi:MAG: geranylgeranylglycerol-phosphate geranylgeranyltransferase [Flavobacteriaceae bacterium]|jgi:4-hydroxybenzoate polyprenyltransferase
MSPPKSRYQLLLSIFGFFTVIRGYNIALLILAQYLTSLYILAPDHSLWEVLFDPQLFALVLATAFSTAAGFIINNFYDTEKDRINRPQKYLLEHLISLKSQLLLYFLLNTAALLSAGFVSFKALLFFGFFISSIWLYSSSLKRLFWISNVIAASLVVFPFFAITLYYKNFQPLIIFHALYLFLLVLIRDIIKDLENYKGDWVTRYQTLPVVFGHSITKIILSILILCSYLPIYWLINSGLGLMIYYYYWSGLFLFFVGCILWWGSKQKMYLWLHNMLKAHILLGVLGIYFMYK